MGNSVTGRFVASYGEQDHEERESLLAEDVTIGVGLDQARDDIVSRTASPLLSHGVGVSHEFSIGLRCIARKVWIVCIHYGIRPCEQLLAVGFGHADQVGDRL